MRDIRSDLQERANLLEEQISAAQGQFEKYLEQLRAEQEGRVKDLKSELEAVQSLLLIEQRRHGVAPGIHCGSVEYATKYLELGCQMVTLGSDTGFMTGRAAADLQAVRGNVGAAAVAPEA